MEQTQTRRDEQVHQPTLEAQVTEGSEKLDDLQLESESIASALEGNTVDENDPKDLEKATTQGSRTSHDPATRIVTAVDFLTDDPENPLQWPFWKKTYHTVAIGSLAFAVTTGSSLITPSTFEIAEHFNVSRTASILSLSLFVLGLALGPVIGAPISETFGRSVVYKVSAPVYMLFLVGAGFSKSFGSLLVCRLLAGMAGAPVLAVGAGSNADMYVLHNRALATACFIMMP